MSLLVSLVLATVGRTDEPARGLRALAAQSWRDVEVLVIDQNEGALLTPRVRVFFSTRSNAHIPPEIVDLGRKPGHGGGDRIVSAEAPDKWGVDPARFLLREG